ncbi:hypothetical protein D3C75_252670 [compost metagenome]
MAALGARQQMINGVPVQAAEMTGVIVSGQDQPAEILVAVQAADGTAVDHNSSMLADERNGQFQVNLLVPAPPLVTVAAHQNHPLV